MSMLAGLPSRSRQNTYGPWLNQTRLGIPPKRTKKMRSDLKVVDSVEVISIRVTRKHTDFPSTPEGNPSRQLVLLATHILTASCHWFKDPFIYFPIS